VPVQRCQAEGRPGYRWGGPSQTCYTYTAGDEPSRKKAKQKAILQGAAIGENMSEQAASTQTSEQGFLTAAARNMAVVHEAVDLEQSESLSDFRNALSAQIEKYLPSIGILRRRWVDDETCFIGFWWYVDEVLDSELVVYLTGDDARCYLMLDWSRTGQVFSFSNPREVVRRTSYAPLDAALRVLDLVQPAEESALAKAFQAALDNK